MLGVRYWGEEACNVVRVYTARRVVNGVERTFTAGYMMVEQTGTKRIAYLPVIEGGVDNAARDSHATSSPTEGGVCIGFADPLSAAANAIVVVTGLLADLDGASPDGGVRVPVWSN